MTAVDEQSIPMPVDLVVGPEVAGQLLQAILACWPREHCSLLYGSTAGGTLRIDGQEAIANRSRDSGRFEISGVDLGQALQRAPNPCAFFHSHPARLALSGEDQLAMRRWSLIWVVGSARWIRETWCLYLAAYLWHQGQLMRFAAGVGSH